MGEVHRGRELGAAVVLVLALAACTRSEPAGPEARSASDAPVRSTSTTAPGRPTLERVAGEPGVLAAEGDQRMVAVAADQAGAVAVAVGSDGAGPALWRAESADVWHRVPRPEEMPPDARLAHVATSATGSFLAVGEVGGAAAAWRSDDGAVWTRAQVDGGPPISFVADGPVGPVAFTEGPDAVAWKSWDGQVWLRSPSALPVDGSDPPEVVGVADAESGVVAVVDRPEGGPELWSSSDGFAWRAGAEAGSELLGTEGRLSVGAVLGGGGRPFLLGGSVADGQGVDAALWRSDDGRAWEAVPADRNIFGGDGHQRITGLVSDAEGRSVAVGSDTPEGGGDADLAVWVAADDGAWQRSDPEALRLPGHQEVRDVVVLGGEVVGVGHERIDGEDDAAVWRVASTPVEAPEPVEGPVVSWTRVEAESLSGSGEQRLSAVAVVDDGYLAVGAARRPLDDGSSADSDAAVWFSSDAREWERVGADGLGAGGDQELLDVARGVDGVVAVGRDGDDAAVWRSADGRDWRRVDAGGAFGGDGSQEVRGVVAMADGFVGVGRDGADGALWGSDDGLVWRRLAPESFGGPGAQVLHGVALGPERVVVVGSDEGEAAVWTSADLVGWERVGLGPGAVTAVDAVDGSVVAVGSTPGADGSTDAVAWRLVGSVWERSEGAGLGGPGNQSLLGVALGEQTAVAVGVTDAGGGDDAASWSSAEAVVWSATPHDENVLGGDGPQRMAGVVNEGDTAVAVGWSGSDAAVWVADQVGASGPAGRL